MLEIRTDRRLIDVREDRSAVDVFRRAHGVSRECAVVMARAILAIERSRSYAIFGYSSAVDFAVGDGMDRGLAVELRNLGRTLEQVPEAEAQITDARITPRDAAAVGKVIRRAESAQHAPEPEVLAAEGRRLIDLSKEATKREFRFETRKSEEEIAQRGREAFQPIPAGEPGVEPLEPLVSQSFVVPESSRDRFFRAKDLAERKAERTMTPGEAFAYVTDDFIRRHDKLLRAPRKRRVGPTGERPRDRYVPAEVERAVRRRAGDRCEFAGCGSRVFHQLAHLVAQRAQGDREFGNLCLLCTAHHTMFDGGAIVLLEMLAEGPVFVAAETGEVFAPSRPRELPPRPPEADRAVRGARGARRARNRWRSGSSDADGKAGSVAEAPPAYGCRSRAGRATPRCRGTSRSREPPG